MSRKPDKIFTNIPKTPQTFPMLSALFKEEHMDKHMFELQKQFQFYSQS